MQHSYALTTEFAVVKIYINRFQYIENGFSDVITIMSGLMPKKAWLKYPDNKWIEFINFV